MVSNLLFYQLLLIALVLICLLVHIGLPDNPPRVPKTPLESKPRRRRRGKKPKPFAGLIHQPFCAACEQGTDPRPQAARVATAGHHVQARTQAHCRYTSPLLS
jgi:hypothetical protein